MRIFSHWLDFLFPPICLSCGEKGQKFLCPDCWLLCESPDPANRCRHCFEELDCRGNLCAECRQNPRLPIIRAYVFDAESPAHLLSLEARDAMAGFAFIQWIQLEWPLPDAIIPMPDADSIAIGRVLAKLLDRPVVRALSSSWKYKEGRLEDHQILLLFDACNSMPILQKCALALSESFPKSIYLLSLLAYVDCHS